MIAGPAIGGLLYAVSPILVYALCCALFLAASILVFRLARQAARASARSRSRLERLFAGIAFIRHQSVVLGAIMLDLFAVLLGGAMALLPIFARDVLHDRAVGPRRAARRARRGCAHRLDPAHASRRTAASAT